ncbi:FecCD family ABC transporter permease [Paenibacillus hexagrammi]|uniref:Iron ABC transporter permease n=1 Tax=Paenibacillus hexagrammi TaxID=2908839 RepID=A0ABY3SLJ1_9BACL|nr:iron ABC transporter permease [Paenibacillus sp. YPD9-1]UJF34089.1 iron ABC transporter permease [Paenibacillus sp. YPD9-1]
MPKQDIYTNEITVLLSRKRRKGLIVLVAMLVATVLIALVSISLGSLRIPIGQIVSVLFGDTSGSNALIILQFRLPRVVAAVLVGAALAIAGSLMQGVIRNSLASPDLIGVTGGASVAVVAFMTLTANQYSIHWVPVIAVAGAFATAALNYVLAWKHGLSTFRLVLIGIGISTAMGALTTFLLISGPSYLASQVLGWMTGTIYGTNWKHIAALVPYLAVFVPLACLFAYKLNIQALGDVLATGLGSRMQRDRFLLLLFSVALAGVAVGIAGTITFIGLLAPHMARRLVGSDYRILMPVSGFIGGLILLLADLAGRMLFQPLDVPAGVFTAGIGAPFFLYLLFRRS